MQRKLPSLEELILQIVPNPERALSASDDELERDIASINEDLRVRLLALQEALLDVRNTIVSVRLCLARYEDWRSEAEVLRTLFLYTGVNLFYSFWNLCGRVLNELYNLGFNYESSGPPMHKILRKCDREIELIKEARRVFEGSVQKQIVELRHRYAHRRGPRYGLREIVNIRMVEGKPKRIERPGTEGSPRLLYELLSQGLIELIGFLPALEKSVDVETARIVKKA